MDLILLEKIKNLGDLGEVVKVTPGYGRNFLLPSGKALPATESNKKVFEERKAELVKKAQDSVSAAKSRAEKINGATVVVVALASEEGKLYGSVGPGEIARAATAAKINLEKSEIDLVGGVFRMVGEYKVIARLHTEVEAEFNVRIEPQKA